MNERKIDMAALPGLVAQGQTTRQIADCYGVKTPAVIRACYRAGVRLPKALPVQPPRKPSGWPTATRADDERLLKQLRMKRAGWSDVQIGVRTRATPAAVKIARCKVLRDDLEASCPSEREADVRREYRKARA